VIMSDELPTLVMPGRGAPIAETLRAQVLLEHSQRPQQGIKFNLAPRASAILEVHALPGFAK
ncbi:hypothetical protein, partial [Klebsiella pneumoniae]|uniref:hypothetical protein n=1 Tax=Klebsiella pneumoniae TaxID=573 RepID=UPI0027308EC2